ncbi:unnamed protein product [Clonostachys solani]|uniref:2-dehydropantoate 2-reductase n=1 Tax=Clonostachys solani TaxID=160281 RepID=A0A9P0EEJ7_9HYPO|nr:unnamed protein product [Clonostachys solani]
MQRQARILLIGGGGIGTIVALNLERGAKARVSAVLRSNFETVTRFGYTIHSVDHGTLSGFRPGEILSAIPTVSDGVEPFDYIICTMKNTPDVTKPSLPELIRPAVTTGRSTIVLVQNGLGIQDTMMEAFPSNVVLSGISLCGSTESSPGVIHQIVPDELLVGPFPATHRPDMQQYEERAIASATDFVARYSASGKTSCHFDANVPMSRWKKLVYNATINPICALTGLDAGEIRICPGLLDHLVRPAMREILILANAHGYVLPDELMDEMIEGDPIELHVEPSMLVDKQRTQYLEVETLLGAPIRAGRSLNIETPILNMLYYLCKGIQYKTQRMISERDKN